MLLAERRIVAAGLGLVYAIAPLFPAFITLTSIPFPGISVVPPAGTVALLVAIGVTLLVGGAVLLRNRAPSSPVWIPSLAWGAAALLSALVGFNPGDGLRFLIFFAAGLVWQAGIWRGYREPGVPRTIFRTWLISGALAALAAILMWATRTPSALYTIAHGRAVGTFVLPGELAGYLILYIPMAVALARVGRGAWRAIAAIAAACATLALVLTFSRAGWIGFGAAIAVLVAFELRTRTQRLVLGGAVLLAALGVVVLTFNVHHNPSENYTRLSIWAAALQIIDRYPLTGTGPFGFGAAYALARLPDGDALAFHAHSLYLTIFAELGVLGAAAFAWTLSRFTSAAVVALRAASGAGRVVAAAVCAGLVGVLVQGVIDVISVILFGMLLPTLALALASAGPQSEELRA